MTFANPALLLLIVLIPVLLLIRSRFRRERGSARFSNLELVAGFGQTWRLRYRWVPTAVGATALALILLALARPQNGIAEADLSTEGIDIVLVLDTSSSMSAGRTDEHSNLVEAQHVLKDFISGREDDHLGLVIFRESSLVLSPLTLDYDALSQLVDGVEQVNLLDGTAIGGGLADGLNLLRDSRARSRVAILLTDGQNNSGSIDPLAAARIAETLGIRVYTIGVIGGGPSLGLNNRGVDERALQEMARVTGGLYFPAESQEALEGIYANIDELEKSRIEGLLLVTHNEIAYYFLAAAVILLGLEVVLRTTFWRQTT